MLCIGWVSGEWMIIIRCLSSSKSLSLLSDQPLQKIPNQYHQRPILSLANATNIIFKNLTGFDSTLLCYVISCLCHFWKQSNNILFLENVFFLAPLWLFAPMATHGQSSIWVKSLKAVMAYFILQTPWSYGNRHHCYRRDHPYHCLIIVVVVGGPFWFLHSLSLCPFSLALVENALSRVIIRKAHRQPYHHHHHHHHHWHHHHHCLLHE